MLRTSRAAPATQLAQRVYVRVFMLIVQVYLTAFVMLELRSIDLCVVFFTRRHLCAHTRGPPLPIRHGGRRRTCLIGRHDS